MSVVESVQVALFLMAIVFAGLLGLYLCIKLFSHLLFRLENANAAGKESGQGKQ